jgi:SLT domain-containing protein
VSSTTLKFLILAEDQGSAAFNKLARGVDGASVAIDRNSAALRTQSKTTQVTAGALLALAKTDHLLEDANALLAVNTEELNKQFRDRRQAALESAGATRIAAEAAKSGGGAFAALQTPMGGAAAAGVALAPVLVTVAAGAGGIGMAALGATRDTRAMAQVLGPLKGEVSAFQASLKPEVLTLFGQGAGIATHVLRDLQPVAASTGKALGGVLGQVDAEFASKTWQDFFGFMERTAGPDVQLLGKLFVDLTSDLPPLLTQLQPVAEELLKTADAGAKVVGVTEQLVAREQQVATAAHQSSGIWGILAGAVKNAYEEMVPGTKALPLLGKSLNYVASQSDPAANGVAAVGFQAALTSPKVMTLAQQVSHLTDAYNSALTPQLAYSNALIAQRNDADNLARALHGSRDMIGLATAAQRNSFTAANTYIQDLLNTASAAVKSGRGVDAQIGSIKNALPLLQHVRGGTHDYWAEVQSLVGWLHRLQQQKAVTERVTVLGNGQWVVPSQRSPSSGPGGGHQLAAGGLVSGGVLGRDSVAALLMPGEVVVPAHMVASGAVDHLRGQLPGFAAGGIVPSYSGALKGLQPWADANQRATVAALTSDIASVMARQFSASLAGYLGPGSASYAADIATVLSAMGLPLSLVPNWERQIQTESGGNLRAVNLTDSNAAAGHPSVGLLQLIPGTFAAYAGPYLRTPPLVNYGGGFVSLDPMAQIYAGIHYADARYDGSMASVIGHGHGYALGTASASPGWAWVGERGPELVRFRGGEQVRPVPGGGNTYNITVNVPVGAHPAQAGKEVIRVIREYENVNGAGWRALPP